jgi:hypothetical protein
MPLAGSYPHTLPQALRNMHMSGTSAKNSSLLRWFPSGSATRLFQLVLGDGQHAFLAHGMLDDQKTFMSCVTNPVDAALGGCSLINAGVFLEADQETLQMSSWPPEIRNAPGALDKCKCTTNCSREFQDMLSYERLFSSCKRAPAISIPRNPPTFEQA